MPLNLDAYAAVLAACPLFDGIAPGDLTFMLDCLAANVRRYPRDDFIFLAGQSTEQLGIVLRGGALVMQEDFWGVRSILARVGPGELFGEAFACAGVPRLPVSVAATEPCEVLLISAKKVFTTCDTACGFHAALIDNMVRILAQKNVALTQKVELVARRTTRDKLLGYLSAEAVRAGADAFDIPFNRQELADYLAVERSAMSAELGRMQREGILRTSRSRFELLKDK